MISLRQEVHVDALDYEITLKCLRTAILLVNTRIVGQMRDETKCTFLGDVRKMILPSRCHQNRALDHWGGWMSSPSLVTWILLVEE